MSQSDGVRRARSDGEEPDAHEPPAKRVRLSVPQMPHRPVPNDAMYNDMAIALSSPEQGTHTGTAFVRTWALTANAPLSTAIERKLHTADVPDDYCFLVRVEASDADAIVQLDQWFNWAHACGVLAETAVENKALTVVAFLFMVMGATDSLFDRLMPEFPPLSSFGQLSVTWHLVPAGRTKTLDNTTLAVYEPPYEDIGESDGADVDDDDEDDDAEEEEEEEEEDIVDDDSDE